MPLCSPAQLGRGHHGLWIEMVGQDETDMASSACLLLLWFRTQDQSSFAVVKENAATAENEESRGWCGVVDAAADTCDAMT